MALFVDKLSCPVYRFRQKWDRFCVTMNQKQRAGEKMERIEGRDTNENWKLPKNVRQMGEPGPGTKILIEDYVYTFLHQMAQNNLTCIKTAVLAGRMEKDTAVYIEGAVEIDMGQEIQKWFTHEHWRDIFQDIRSWFDGLEVVGWYMANPGFPPILSEELKSLHLRNFSGNAHVFFQTDVLDNEEVFYMRGEKGLAPVCGYYIYYEKNDRMQEYMSQRKGGIGIEPEGVMRDRAAARFRNVMQEKKEQNVQKKMFAFLYTSCMFLVLVILVIGVTLVNNYDRMANMENALHQISENLETETGSVEEAMEAENRQAQAETESVQEGEQAVPEDNGSDDGSQEESRAEPEETSPEPEEEQPEEQPPVSDETTPQEPDEGSSDGNAETESGEEAQEVMSQAVQEPERYQVKMGDTLLNICRARYGTDDMLDRICEVNGLEDGNVIYVGEIILLP